MSDKKPRPEEIDAASQRWTQLVSFNSENREWDSQDDLLAWGTLVTLLLPEIDYTA